jgi:uncharacterized membrane protein YraQ (UPF0718 family)
MVVARVTAALIMASVVGLVMTWFFAGERSEVKAPAAETSGNPGVIIGRHQLILMLLIALSLLLPNYIIQTGSYINKVIVWAIFSIIAAVYAWKAISPEEIKSMLRETWWFVKIIFPLLLAGVFLVGVLGKLLPETWIRQWLGGNGVLPSFLATMIGAISYFATMTEAPFVDTLMNLGMGKGPALALLLTGPGLSLPNWIAIARVFTVKMSIVYVVTLVVLGTFVGWFYGNFIF